MKAKQVGDFIIVADALVNGVHKKPTQKGTSYLIYIVNEGKKDVMFSVFENLQRPLGYTMPNKGDTVSFTCRQNGQYRNIDGAIIITKKATVSHSSNGGYNDDLSKVGMITGACLNQACSIIKRETNNFDFRLIEEAGFELAKINLRLKKRIEELIKNPETVSSPEPVAQEKPVEEILNSTPSPQSSPENIFNFDEGSEVSF